MGGGFSRDALLTAPEGLRFPWPVRLQEVDAGGVVFFARYFEAFNDALAVLLEQCGHPLPELIRSGYLLPLVHAEASFLSPLRFGEQAAVLVVRARCGARGRLRLGFRVERADGSPAAIGATDHRIVQAADFSRAEWPAPLREALERLF